MPTWVALLVVAALWLAGLMCMGVYLKSVIEQTVAEYALRLKTEYEQIVTRQSLTEARRLVDANRKRPVRPDAGPPVRIYRKRLRG